MEKQELIRTEAQSLMDLMQIKAQVEVLEEEGGFEVKIEAGEENGLLIGKRGETLNALQYMLGIFLRETLSEGEHVVVNVGDWREKKEDYLKNLATETAARAKETGEDQPIYNLTPAERRIVHLTLSEESGIKTESVGEGDERYLVVKPKKN